MMLRKKTLIPIVVILIALVAILYGISRFIILRSFAELEEQDVRRNVERVVSALSDKIEHLGSLVADWAAWDDTYEFIEDGNEDYVKTNLVNGTFDELRLNFMLFFNSSGRIVFSKGYDLNNNREISIPKSFLEHLSGNQFILRHSDIQSKKGIVLLPEGPVLISSHPIVPSDEQGPMRGTMIMGRYLDYKQIKDLEITTHLSLTFLRLKDLQIPSDFHTTILSQREGPLILVRPLNEQSIAGYALLNDIYGKPALILKIDMPRQIYTQGRESLSYYLWSLLALGIIFIGITLLLLERLVLSRLANLHKFVDSIATSRDLSKRILIKGDDELSKLAFVMNEMLEWIQRSQESLQDSEERYRSLVEAAPDVIFTLSPEDGGITSLNPAFEKATGLFRSEWIGRPFKDIIHPDDVSISKEKFHQVLNGTVTSLFELRVTTKSSEYRVAEFVAAPEIKNRKVSRVFGFARDITKRKQVEEALKESEKKLRYLSSHLLMAQERERRRISLELHDELGQALTVLKLKLRAIEKNLRDDQTALRNDCESTLQYIDQIIENARRLSRDLAPTIIEDLGLSAALRRLVGDFTRYLDIKSSVDIADIDHLFSDEAQITIYRILQEVLTNTIKHAKATHISIVAKKHEDTVLFLVEDNGKGFDVEQLITSEVDNKGLGLAAMDERTRMLGGSLDIWSQEGAGTRITITIPIGNRGKQ